MLFEHLKREDGKAWREELRAAAEYGEPPARLDDAVLAARAAIDPDDDRGDDRIDVLSSIIAAAVTADRSDLHVSTGNELLAHLRERVENKLVHEQDDVSENVGEDVGVRLFDALAFLMSRKDVPRSGGPARLLADLVRRGLLDMGRIEAHIEEKLRRQDQIQSERLLAAHVYLQLDGGADASLERQHLAWWHALQPVLADGQWWHYVRRALVRFIRRCGDGCEDQQRLRAAAGALPGWASVGPPKVVEAANALALDGMRRALAHFDGAGCSQPARHRSGTMTDLAQLLRGAADGLVEAEALYRRSLVIAREGCGPEDPQVHVTESQLGGLLLQAGRTEEALAILEPLLPRRLAQHRVSEGAYVTSLQLAETFRRLGRLDDAERVARDAIAISQEARLLSFEARDVLADVLDDRGQPDDAALVRDYLEAREFLGVTC